ncbi:MAG: hypothetical protein NVS9B7_09340 [Flavisolibacter sp.]
MPTIEVEERQPVLEAHQAGQPTQILSLPDLNQKSFNEWSEYHSSKELLIVEIEKSKRMIIILVSLVISLSIIFIGLLIK